VSCADLSNPARSQEGADLNDPGLSKAHEGLVGRRIAEHVAQRGDYIC
jgi:hypothetical protein